MVARTPSNTGFTYILLDLLIQPFTDLDNKCFTVGLRDYGVTSETLKALRTNSLTPNTDISKLLEEAESLQYEIDMVEESLDASKKRLKDVTEQIKQYALEQFRDGDTRVSLRGQRYEFVLAKSNTTELDKEALKADGLLEKYTKEKSNYRLTKTAIKED